MCSSRSVESEVVCELKARESVVVSKCESER